MLKSLFAILVASKQAGSVERDCKILRTKDGWTRCLDRNDFQGLLDMARVDKGQDYGLTWDSADECGGCPIYGNTELERIWRKYRCKLLGFQTDSYQEVETEGNWALCLDHGYRFWVDKHLGDKFRGAPWNEWCPSFSPGSHVRVSDGLVDLGGFDIHAVAVGSVYLQNKVDTPVPATLRCSGSQAVREFRGVMDEDALWEIYSLGGGVFAFKNKGHPSFWLWGVTQILGRPSPSPKDVTCPALVRAW